MAYLRERDLWPSLSCPPSFLPSPSPSSVHPPACALSSFRLAERAKQSRELQLILFRVRYTANPPLSAHHPHKNSSDLPGLTQAEKHHDTIKMAFLDTLADRSSSGGFPGALSRLILRLLQFILAITVAGLYGVDLHHARQAHAYTDGKWVFAEVVAGLAAVTCLVYAVVAVTGWGTYRAAPWDWVILWVRR